MSETGTAPSPWWTPARHADVRPFLAARGAITRAVRAWFDEQGFAEVQWHLGATVGAQTVTATAEGLVNSPLVFSATGAADPSTLPLTLAEVLPLNSATNTSITTAT